MSQPKSNNLFARLIKNTKLRFILAGLTNTAIDFIVFNILFKGFGVDIGVATVCSVAVAVAASYLLNKHLVFKVGGKALSRHLPLFVGATLAVQWVVQVVVIHQVVGMLDGLGHAELFAGLSGDLKIWLITNVAKAVAVVFGAAANYLLYTRVVFREQHMAKDKK